MKRFRWLALLAALAAPIPLLGDVGVLIPSGSDGPDPTILSLDEMAADIRIDNGDARVSVRQIFGSHRPGVLEGEYRFSMPGRATVSDFAVWDGVTRIPGVILERRRAEEIYENLKQQAIDPGLLQQGEQGSEGAAEAARTSAFSARIVPIPGFGTKRLEIEYHEVVPVENLRSAFVLPLRPDAYNAQTAGRLTISFSLASAHAVRDFRVVSRAYPLQIREQTANRVTASFTGRNVAFSEDFSVEYALDAAKSDTLEVTTYRSPRPAAQNPDRCGAAPARRGARILPGVGAGRTGAPGGCRRDSCSGAHGDRALRHLALHAMGQARTQLPGARGRPPIAAAVGPVQPAALQHPNDAVRAGAGGRRPGRGRAFARVRARRPAARRHRSGARAWCGPRSEPAGNGRSLSRPAWGRERHRRLDCERAAGGVVREATHGDRGGGAPAHLSARHRRGRQRAAAEDAQPRRRSDGHGAFDGTNRVQDARVRVEDRRAARSTTCS